MAKNKNFLDYVPVKNPLYLDHVDADGIVVVRVPKMGFFDILAQKIAKTPKVSNIRLDEYGSFIWPLIDGKRTIYEISIQVKEHFGEQCEPLYDRIAKYFQILKEHKFVTLEMK